MLDRPKCRAPRLVACLHFFSSNNEITKIVMPCGPSTIEKPEARGAIHAIRNQAKRFTWFLAVVMFPVVLWTLLNAECGMCLSALMHLLTVSFGLQPPIQEFKRSVILSNKREWGPIQTQTHAIGQKEKKRMGRWNVSSDSRRLDIPHTSLPPKFKNATHLNSPCVRTRNQESRAVHIYVLAWCIVGERN